MRLIFSWPHFLLPFVLVTNAVRAEAISEGLQMQESARRQLEHEEADRANPEAHKKTPAAVEAEDKAWLQAENGKVQAITDHLYGTNDRLSFKIDSWSNLGAPPAEGAKPTEASVFVSLVCGKTFIQLHEINIGDATPGTSYRTNSAPTFVLDRARFAALLSEKFAKVSALGNGIEDVKSCHFELNVGAKPKGDHEAPEENSVVKIIPPPVHGAATPQAFTSTPQDQANVKKSTIIHGDAKFLAPNEDAGASARPVGQDNAIESKYQSAPAETEKEQIDRIANSIFHSKSQVTIKVSEWTNKSNDTQQAKFIVNVGCGGAAPILLSKEIDFGLAKPGATTALSANNEITLTKEELLTTLREQWPQIGRHLYGPLNCQISINGSSLMPHPLDAAHAFNWKLADDPRRTGAQRTTTFAANEPLTPGTPGEFNFDMSNSVKVHGVGKSSYGSLPSEEMATFAQVKSTVSWDGVQSPVAHTEPKPSAAPAPTVASQTPASTPEVKTPAASAPTTAPHSAKEVVITKGAAKPRAVDAPVSKSPAPVADTEAAPEPTPATAAATPAPAPVSRDPRAPYQSLRQSIDRESGAQYSKYGRKDDLNIDAHYVQVLAATPGHNKKVAVSFAYDKRLGKNGERADSAITQLFEDTSLAKEIIGSLPPGSTYDTSSRSKRLLLYRTLVHNHLESLKVQYVTEHKAPYVEQPGNIVVYPLMRGERFDYEVLRNYIAGLIKNELPAEK